MAGKLPYRKKGNRHLVPGAAPEAFKAERDRKLDALADLAAAEEGCTRAHQEAGRTM